MDLNDYRKEIDSIDDQLIALFAQRMETAEKIAEYKKANGLRVLDARREKEKMREILDKTPDDLRELLNTLLQTHLTGNTPSLASRAYPHADWRYHVQPEEQEVQQA